MKKWKWKVILVYVVCFFGARFLVGADSPELILHPYAMALFGTLYLESRLPRRVSFLVILAGVASAGRMDLVLRYGICMLTLLFVAAMAERNWLFRRKEEAGGQRLELLAMALLGGIITAAVRAGGSFLSVTGEWTLALAEGLLVIGMTVVLQSGVHFLLYPPEREVPEGKTIISLVLLVLGALCGVPEPAGFSLVYPGAVLAALYLGYHYGIGAATIAGALGGAALGILWGEPELVGYFALFGMVSTAMGELGRVPMVLTWLMLQASAGFLWNPFFVSTEGLVGVLPVLMLFLILPKRRAGVLPREEEELYDNVQVQTRERMRDISMAFRKLAELMGGPIELQSGLSGGDLNRVFNQVSHQCCDQCERQEKCMKTEFYDTYHQTFQILNRAERRGMLESDMIPAEFLERCIHPEQFLAEVGRSLELARSNLAWQNRMAENRVVVAEQFAGVAGMMDEVVQEMGISIHKKNREEERIRECVHSAGLEVRQVSVRAREDGRMEIFLTVRMPEGGCMTARELAVLLGGTTGKVCHPSFGSKAVVSSEWGTLVFLEDTAFCFYSGVASCNREGEMRTGDSHSVQELPRGEAVLLLSDGMGSGGQAFRESSRMVELLEQFLEAGLESSAAMKLIQSSLFLRSAMPARAGEESFVTVDLFRVDLCSGLTRYLKVGAADSFLVRDSVVNRLSSPGLPAGILAPRELQEEELQLREGDFLVMVTDGFLDCFREGDVLEIIRSVISGRRQNNARELARILLDSALIQCGGSPQDDITVLVTGFWENERLAREASGW